MFDPIWVTRDGRFLKISEMETSHVLNAIAKIRRSRSGWRIEYLDRLELELVIRSIGRET